MPIQYDISQTRGIVKFDIIKLDFLETEGFNEPQQILFLLFAYVCIFSIIFLKAQFKLENYALSHHGKAWLVEQINISNKYPTICPEFRLFR